MKAHVNAQEAAIIALDNCQTLNARALIIGSGISGLLTAIKLVESGVKPVIVVTKSRLIENNSRYAQGGIAAVLPTNSSDSLEAHVADTLVAGAGQCNEDAVRSILSESADAIEDLIATGVVFDVTDKQEIALTREAAHSQKRILHAGGDATGRTIEQALIDKCASMGNDVIALEYTAAHAVLRNAQNACIGALAQDLRTLKLIKILAPHTVLATGGVGRLFAQTTNPTVATGDGWALASDAGAPLQDLAYIQFHPTAFYHQGRVRFLVSEALRGEGAVLQDAAGERFAHQYHPDAELAPRDVVTRAIFSHMQVTQQPCVYLNATHMGSGIQTRFPTITAACLKYNINPAQQAIPVAPAAHYAMGGIQVTPYGQTPVQGLWAVGEAACTRLHGANRLASNSLLECLVLARRSARGIAEALTTQALGSGADDAIAVAPLMQTLGPELSPTPIHTSQRILINKLLHQLYATMWQHVGIVRTPQGMASALSSIATLNHSAETICLANPGIHPRLTSLKQQLNVAQRITQAAIALPESVGAHYLKPQTTAEMQQGLKHPTASVASV
ncbi:MAG: L-aspartate oxidase [Vampirovibrionales bacterium]|nr:L-aspartate oxidase [Vampirovibrionales bacterium]